MKDLLLTRIQSGIGTVLQSPVYTYLSTLESNELPVYYRYVYEASRLYGSRTLGDFGSTANTDLVGCLDTVANSTIDLMIQLLDKSISVPLREQASCKYLQSMEIPINSQDDANKVILKNSQGNTAACLHSETGLERLIE